MALVPIFQPQTESEIAIAISFLEAHGIHYFVHGQHFGSLLPGLYIDSYNTRSIMVAEEQAAEALALLIELRNPEPPNAATPPMKFRDKLRVLLETLLFGWFIPGRRRKSK